MHVASSGLPLGTVAGRVCMLSAGSAELHVTVRGRDGRGSDPHQAAGPIPVAAEALLAEVAERRLCQG
ncbi:peptidase dimerization domain-containing protein [Streptomyces triticiradicis]|uniref:peptidase dimerization domain-containing protein n=1 Tax=Streptomyces triticiradicis TaxID=2651189 RepID=UPI001788BFCD|nr:peptidase dimerization domain-containing protein [Streptomyces triticiradicis]